MKTYKILICGTGAIGGYFGGRLALNKNLNVRFLSHGTTYGILKSQGLKVNSINGDFHIYIDVTDTLSVKKEHFDYIFVAVKSNDTENLFYELDKAISPNTCIISLQNGIYNFNILSKRYGEDRVLQGVCKIGVEMKDGIIYHTALGMIIMGEISGIISQRLVELENIFRNSNIKMKITKNIRKEIWIKYVWNSIFNTLTAKYKINTDEIFISPEYSEMMNSMYDELRNISATQGIVFGDEEYKKIISDTSQLKGFKTSSLQDIEKSKQTEVKYFLSELIKIAKDNHLSIPVIEQCYLN